MRQTCVTLKLSVKHYSSYPDPFEEEAENAVPPKPFCQTSLKGLNSTSNTCRLHLVSQWNHKTSQFLCRHIHFQNIPESVVLPCAWTQKLKPNERPSNLCVWRLRMWCSALEGPGLCWTAEHGHCSRAAGNLFSLVDKTLLFAFVNISRRKHCNVFIVNGLSVSGLACLTKQYNLYFKKLLNLKWKKNFHWVLIQKVEYPFSRSDLNTHNKTPKWDDFV